MRVPVDEDARLQAVLDAHGGRRGAEPYTGWVNADGWRAARAFVVAHGGSGWRWVPGLPEAAPVTGWAALEATDDATPTLPTLEMWAQPIVDHAGTPVGYELLARGRDSEGGLLGYPALRAWAETRGALFWLDRRCREEALRQGRRLAGPNQFLSINFLPSVIYRPEDCLATTSAVLAETGLRPEQVVLEVVEAETVDEGRLAAIVQYYRARHPGIRFALDDLGAGVNGLTRILDLRPEVLKLDAAITRALARDPVARAIARAVRSLADELRVACIAEGVEDAATATWLREAGFPWFQGYFWGRPQPVAAWSSTGR